jgi:hypothetical protein
MQKLGDFRRSLAQYFKIRRSFPTSYNWNHSEPGRRLVKAANMNVNVNIPFVGRMLGVEFFLICSARAVPHHVALAPVRFGRAGSGPGPGSRRLADLLRRH